MPKFRFIGNGKHDPESITVLGVTFELNGEPQEGPERLRGNSHFQEVTDEEPKRRGRPRKELGDDGNQD